MAVCCIALQVPEKNRAGGFKFVADELQPKQPATESVFLVVSVQGLGAGILDFISAFAHCEAKLNVCLDFPGVNASLFAVVFVGKLEKPEFNGALGEASVQVEHVVTTLIVVLIATITAILRLVPHVRKCLHGFGLFPVKPFDESWVDNLAVGAGALPVNANRAPDLRFVRCHDVGEIAQCVGVVVTPVKPFQADVNVYATPTARAALCARLAQFPKKLLENLDVGIVQNRCDQLALFCVWAADGNIIGELPFAVLGVPRAPRHIAVNVGGVLIPIGTEEFGGDLRGLFSGDVVHLDFDAERLGLHALLELHRDIAHGVLLSCPFGAVGVVLHLMV